MVAFKDDYFPLAIKFIYEHPDVTKYKVLKELKKSGFPNKPELCRALLTCAVKHGVLTTSQPVPNSDYVYQISSELQIPSQMQVWEIPLPDVPGWLFNSSLESQKSANPQATCTICLESLYAAPVAALFAQDCRACSHFFHMHCVSHALVHRCPLCRAEHDAVREVPSFTSPEAWTERKDQKGYRYWKNSVTLAWSWYKPECLKSPAEKEETLIFEAVRALVIPYEIKAWTEPTGSDGFRYYYNTFTKGWSWDKPDALHEKKQSNIFEAALQPVMVNNDNKKAAREKVQEYLRLAIEFVEKHGPSNKFQVKTELTNSGFPNSPELCKKLLAALVAQGKMETIDHPPPRKYMISPQSQIPAVWLQAPVQWGQLD